MALFEVKQTNGFIALVVVIKVVDFHMRPWSGTILIGLLGKENVIMVLIVEFLANFVTIREISCVT